MGGYYWYSDNPNCGRCGHLNGRGFCNMTACIYPVLPQTAVMTKHHLTNADRIRDMTDEELAEFLNSNAWYRVIKGVAFTNETWTIDWLKQEVDT